MQLEFYEFVSFNHKISMAIKQKTMKIQNNLGILLFPFLHMAINWNIITSNFLERK